MLLDLPVELLLSILKHLPVSDIATCLCTSKSLNFFINEHESTVYRQAAAHPSLHVIPHGHVLFPGVFPPGWHSKRFLGEARNWRELCRRACEVRSSWLGKGPSRIRNYQERLSEHPDVHRIKVDEKRGFLITTHKVGGLVVSDINEGTPIWGLDQDYVREHAHCEYGDGFIIFDRTPHQKEVWRLVSDDPEISCPDAFEVVPESQPDDGQHEAQRLDLPEGRLRFVPHAVIHPPDNIATWAFRFVYPTLVVAAQTALLLWDVRTGRLVEHMSDIRRQMPAAKNMNAPSGVAGQHGDTSTNSNQSVIVPSAANEDGDESDWSDEDGSMDTGSQSSQSIGPQIQTEENGELGQVCYVEVNDKYALVCGSKTLKVFSRRTRVSGPDVSGDGNAPPTTASCALALTRFQLRRRGKWFFQTGYVKSSDLPDGFKSWPERGKNDPKAGTWRHLDRVVVSHEVTVSRTSRILPEAIAGRCLAAHFSACGQHLAVLATNSRLLIIPYLERVVDGRVKDIHDITIDVQLNASTRSVYLAYEDDRIGVVTALGLFVVHPKFTRPDDFTTPPQIEIQRVTALNKPWLLAAVSCLQMTSTALWLNWTVRLNPRLIGFDPSVVRNVEQQIAVETEKQRTIHEEIFEESVATGNLPNRLNESASWVDGLPGNSFVFSVDFGLGS